MIKREMHEGLSEREDPHCGSDTYLDHFASALCHLRSPGIGLEVLSQTRNTFRFVWTAPFPYLLNLCFHMFGQQRHPDP